MATKGNALLRLSFVAALLVVMEAGANSIQIDINTGSLGLGGTNWDLAFDLIDGNPQPNSVRISSFSITGGALTSNATFYGNSGNVTGDLSVAPGIVTLNDSSPLSPSLFNEYTHNANLGSLISFVFDITGNKDAGFEPDTFSFFLLDPATGQPFQTADPTGAFFVYSIGNDNQPALFCPIATNCVTATPIGAVPEPGALALAMAGLLALGARRAARKPPLRRDLTA